MRQLMHDRALVQNYYLNYFVINTAHLRKVTNRFKKSILEFKMIKSTEGVQ